MYEDSSFEGWTSPPTPGGPNLGWPEGSRLEGAPPRGWVGEVRSLPKASEDSIKYAARTWPQLDAESFDRVGDRTFVERATGVEYKLVRGNPLLGEGGLELADLFIVVDDSILFLVRSDRPATRSQSVGSISGVAATS